MRVLIGLHHVTLGGDTLNAVELAGRLISRAHLVTLLAFTNPDGSDDDAPLIRLAHDRGIPVRTFQRPRGMRTRMRVIRELRDYAHQQNFDVVHTYGHQDTYYAFVATYGLAGVPLVVNDYAMSVTEALPRRVPLIVGTRQVADQARRVRLGDVCLIEPPVDVELNAPGVVDSEPLRMKFGISSSDTLLVMVSRLVKTMKGEGLRSAIDAVRILSDPSIRLMLVGDGDARADLADHAAKVNAELGREAVVLTGAMRDPRPAYAAADIVLGMGHSGLRGMAFAKPVVVVGERGFCLPLTPETFKHVDYVGVYGFGDGSDAGPELAATLRPLILDLDTRRSLGEFGRKVVCERYSLDVATDQLEAVYESARRRRSRIAWLLDAGHIGRCYAPAKIRRIILPLVRQLGA